MSTESDEDDDSSKQISTIISDLGNEDTFVTRKASKILIKRLKDTGDVNKEFILWYSSLSECDPTFVLGWHGIQCFCTALHDYPELLDHIKDINSFISVVVNHSGVFWLKSESVTASIHCSLLGALQLLRTIYRTELTRFVNSAIITTKINGSFIWNFVSDVVRKTKGHHGITKREQYEIIYETCKLFSTAARYWQHCVASEIEGIEGIIASDDVKQILYSLEEMSTLLKENEEQPGCGCALLGDVPELHLRAKRCYICAAWILICVFVFQCKTSFLGSVNHIRELLLLPEPSSACLDQQFILLRDNDAALMHVLEACGHLSHICSSSSVPHSAGSCQTECIGCYAWFVCMELLSRYFILVAGDWSILADLIHGRETCSKQALLQILQVIDSEYGANIEPHELYSSVFKQLQYLQMDFKKHYPKYTTQPLYTHITESLKRLHKNKID